MLRVYIAMPIAILCYGYTSSASPFTAHTRGRRAQCCVLYAAASLMTTLLCARSLFSGLESCRWHMATVCRVDKVKLALIFTPIAHILKVFRSEDATASLTQTVLLHLQISIHLAGTQRQSQVVPRDRQSDRHADVG